MLGRCCRGDVTLLTPINNLSSSKREEKIRGDSKGSKYRGANKDTSGRNTNERQQSGKEPSITLASHSTYSYCVLRCGGVCKIKSPSNLTQTSIHQNLSCFSYLKSLGFY